MKDARPRVRHDEGSVCHDEDVRHDGAKGPHREKLRVRRDEDTFIATM